MKNPSRRTFFAALTAIPAFTLLSSCSNSSDDSGNVDRSKINPSEVSRFINDFYHASFESSMKNFENGKDLDKSLLSIVGAEKYYELTQAKDPYFALSNLPQDDKDKISKSIEEFNTTSNLYKTDTLNSDQKLYLNISVISLNNTLPSSWRDSDWTITASPEKIKFNDLEAQVNYVDLDYVFEGRDQKVKTLPGAARTLFMIFDDNRWKINGKKHMDQLLKLGVGISGDGDY